MNLSAKFTLTLVGLFNPQMLPETLYLLEGVTKLQLQYCICITK